MSSEEDFLSVAFIKDLSDGRSTMAAVKVSDLHLHLII